MEKRRTLGIAGGEKTQENKLSNQKLAIVLSLVAILCFSAGFIVNFGTSQGAHRSPSPKENLFVFKETAWGKSLILSGNVITDIGENWTEQWMTGCGAANTTSRSAPMYFSLGNATVAQTLTKLTTEATNGGFARAAATASIAFKYGTDVARNFTKTFTATSAMTINAAGAHWDSTGNSDNNMYACGALGTDQLFNINDNCTIIWMDVWDSN